MTARRRFRFRDYGLMALAIGLAAACSSSRPPTSTATSAPATTVPAPTTAPGTTAAPATTAVSATTAAPHHSAAEALAFVKSIYDPYAGADLDSAAGVLLGSCFGGAKASCRLDVDHYVTPQLGLKLEDYARTQNADAVDCAQNVPGTVSYDAPVRTDGSVTITVHTFYSEAGDNPIRVTVDLNSLKLTDLVCLRTPGT